jgi:hypothetical protein
VKIHQIIAATLVMLLLFSVILNAPRDAKAAYDLSQVAYYDRVKQALNLSSEQESMLEKYGFTIIEMPYTYTPPNEEDPLELETSPGTRFEDFYWQKVYNPDLPVFVTTDSILHLFHVIFDCSLRIVEYQMLYPMILNVTQYAFEKSLSDYYSIPHDDSIQYWAVRNATVYFAVAMSLISSQYVTLPSELEADLNFFLNEIYAEPPQFILAGGWIANNQSSSLQYDFTQFKVRGHYLGTPRLEQYFRTMMWYGNFPICIPRNDEEYVWLLSHVDGPAVVYMRDILKLDQNHFDEWITLYNVTSALVGESDSINPLTLEIALHNAFGDSDQYLNLVAKPDGLTAFRDEVGKPEYSQQILGQAIESVGRYPVIFQFMGQRYVPDSYMFQQLCYDKVGRNSLYEKRIMPKGLDVFAVLGSERANELLTPDFDFNNYPENLANLTSRFNNMTEEEWTHSSYTSWIYSLESLVDVEHDARYPEFMRNLAWKDEKLNTALGSWAQLRHDTILYAKQPYIPIFVCSYPEAFVEPYPDFYSRMQQLSEKTIAAINMLPTNSVAPIPMFPGYEPEPSTIIMDSLESIRDITQKLEVISTKELAHQPLTTEEIDFLKQIAYSQGIGGSGGRNPVGWYVDAITFIAEAANYTALLHVPVIADIATFPPGDIEYPPQILHVGVGGVNALVVLYPMLNGTLAAAVGPVFSYYEFPLIGTKRLNDDEWKTMLTWSNSSAYRPSWINDVYAKAEPYIVPEQTTTVVLIATLVISSLSLVYLKKMGRTKKTHLPSSFTN